MDTYIEGNKTIKEICENENVTYFDFTTGLFDKENISGKYYKEGYGSLRTDIWLNDNLHFNSEGYELVTELFLNQIK